MTLGAHLSGYPGYFSGEAIELVDHGIDGILQFQYLALNLNRNLLREVTLSNCGSYHGDIPYLIGQIGCQGVHVVGQLLPGTGHAFYLSLSAKLTLGAHLSGYPGYFSGEGVELVNHGVGYCCYS